MTLTGSDPAAPRPSFVLSLTCANRPGIVAAVATALFEAGGNISEAQQFDDTATGRFFMRVVFDVPGGPAEPEIREAMARVAGRFGMEWLMRDPAAPRRVMLMVSKFDHCLVDLLYRWRIRELNIDPVCIISNHSREIHAGVELNGIPFFHLPVFASGRPAQEAEVWRLFQHHRADLVVLARYMQILSGELAAKLAGRCINIHHSFLPGFKGARPYHQAHARGVKLIGATAHFVTGDLDEGPIIEQDVERITHGDSPDDLVRKGRDIERRVLARAVRCIVEDRVLLNGGKTVVFG